MQMDHFEVEVDLLQAATASRERDLEYKMLEEEHAKAELKVVE